MYFSSIETTLNTKLELKNTYFPFLAAVNIISCNLPLLVHIRQMECFERINTGRTILGHCSSVSDLSPETMRIEVNKCQI